MQSDHLGTVVRRDRQDLADDWAAGLYHQRLDLLIA